MIYISYTYIAIIYIYIHVIDPEKLDRTIGTPKVIQRFGWKMIVCVFFSKG